MRCTGSSTCSRSTQAFATVGVIGIQTLSRVDFHDERNVIIVAVSVGLALVPVAFPTFYQYFPLGLQIIVGSGITMKASQPSS